jgi:hypothetical protein
MVPEVTEGNGVEQHLGTYLCPDCEAMWGVEPPADDEDYDDPADVLREQNELYFASVWPVKET